MCLVWWHPMPMTCPLSMGSALHHLLFCYPTLTIPLVSWLLGTAPSWLIFRRCCSFGHVGFSSMHFSCMTRQENLLHSPLSCIHNYVVGMFCIQNEIHLQYEWLHLTVITLLLWWVKHDAILLSVVYYYYYYYYLIFYCFIIFLFSTLGSKDPEG